MRYHSFNKKIIIILVTFAIMVIATLGSIVFRTKNNKSKNNLNPTPGSSQIQSAKPEEKNKNQIEKVSKLNEQLARAPRDPKIRCEIVHKFHAEQRRDEKIKVENERYNKSVKIFGNNHANEYIHRQNLEKIQSTYNKEIQSIDC